MIIMVENDTVRLLRECDAGLRMGADSIGEVMDFVKDATLAKKLMDGKSEHERLISQVERELAEEGGRGKEPAVMAKGMSWIKTNVKLASKASDNAVADLVYDGCYMGMKSLHRYKNQYKAAAGSARDLADKIIGLEQSLSQDMQAYL